MEWSTVLNSFLSALGLGLLIGVIRERRRGNSVEIAGTRTHALVAVVGFVTWGMGPPVFVAALILVGLLTAAGYYLTSIHDEAQDKGLTGEVAVLVSMVLGGLAFEQPQPAVAVGVVCAILLYAKQPLQRLSREWIGERELQDALMLAAAALVVLPLLPQGAIDPWGVLKPYTLWRIVVLVMAVGMVGHVAMRMVGARWGLPIAGFFSGFASSTATVAGMGARVKAEPECVGPAAAAALLSNVASVLLFGGVVATASAPLLQAIFWPLVASLVALAAVAGVYLRQGTGAGTGGQSAQSRAFKFSHALLLAAVIAGVSLLAAWLGQLYGDAGVLAAAILVALAEIHAAAAGVAQVSATGSMTVPTAAWGLVGVLAASVLAKSVLAFVSGGLAYGRRVATGLLVLVAVFGGVLLAMLPI